MVVPLNQMVLLLPRQLFLHRSFFCFLVAILSVFMGLGLVNPLLLLVQSYCSIHYVQIHMYPPLINFILLILEFNLFPNLNAPPFWSPCWFGILNEVVTRQTSLVSINESHWISKFQLILVIDSFCQTSHFSATVAVMTEDCEVLLWVGSELVV